ncbi:hypothetical protein JCGZ_06335 [Jatropha curcas]|uniref:Uncharacterized protein n=1 Tax=Jatropha curcas TaxID=180498 RepID=A0A067KRR6_JATCU|nr:hypothetical protein JCGZ_06335 [Jatropha curcas]
MEESQEVDGAKVIFEEETVDDFREEIKLHELSPMKLDDILIRVQDPLEEINFGTSEDL